MAHQAAERRHPAVATIVADGVRCSAGAGSADVGARSVDETAERDRSDVLGDVRGRCELAAADVEAEQRSERE